MIKSQEGTGGRRPCWVTVLGLALMIAAGPSGSRAQSAHSALVLLHSGQHDELGLGGDPFCSAVDDETGWWSRVDASGKSVLGLRRVDSNPISVTVGGERRVFTGSATSLWLGRSIDIGGRRIRVQADLSAPRSEFALGGEDAGTRVAVAGHDGSVWLRVDEVLPGLTAQAGGTVWREESSRSSREAGIGLRGRWGSWLSVQSAYTEEQHPQVGQSRLLEEGVALGLNLKTSAVAHDLRLRLPLSVTLEGSHWHADLREISALSSDVAYELIPAGRAERWSCALRWEPVGSYRLKIRRTGMFLDVAADAYLASAKFARLKYLRGGGSSWLVGLDRQWGDHTRILFDTETTELRGDAYGYIESWPFTSAVVDFFGASQRFKTTASATWTRLHSGLSRDVGGGRWQAGFNWYHLRPRLLFETWQKTLLGNRAYQTLETRSGTIDLASVSMGVRRPVYGWEVGLSIQQFVYARSRAKLRANAADEAGGEPILPAGNRAKRSAGTFWAFELERTF